MAGFIFTPGLRSKEEPKKEEEEEEEEEEPGKDRTSPTPKKSCVCWPPYAYFISEFELGAKKMQKELNSQLTAKAH